MKTLLYLLIFIGVLGLSAFAQKDKSKVAPLPAGIAGWSGEDSDKLLKDPLIDGRLRRLLGKTRYDSFFDSFETITPIIQDGDLLFASGCLIHACTHLESAIAIDLKNNTVHAAIFRQDKPTRYFNERGRKTPASISAWANRLRELNAPMADK